MAEKPARQLRRTFTTDEAIQELFLNSDSEADRSESDRSESSDDHDDADFVVPQPSTSTKRFCGRTYGTTPPQPQTGRARGSRGGSGRGPRRGGGGGDMPSLLGSDDDDGTVDDGPVDLHDSHDEEDSSDPQLTTRAGRGASRGRRGSSRGGNGLGRRGAGRRGGSGRGQSCGNEGGDADMGLLMDADAEDGWTLDDGSPDLPRFTATPGLKIDIPPEAEALYFFQIFLGEDIITHIVEETNRYASQAKDLERQKYMCKKWYDTNNEEMKTFIGLLMLMGLNVKTDVRHYWSTDHLIETPIYSETMTRERFEAIMVFFHLNDNEKQPVRQDPNFDKLYKIRPLWDHLVERYSSVYYPEQNIAVDESMIPWKGRLQFRQYIPSKPYKYGIKLYFCCESNSGYVYTMKMYTGKEGLAAEVGHGENQVKHLLTDMLGKGHVLFVDSFFSSPALFEYLRENGVLACGTVRRNRKGMPRSLFSKEIKLRKGEHVERRKNNMMAMRYQDKKDIYFISTAHTARPVRTGRQDRETGAAVKKPEVVHEYNKYMGAVDQMDQHLAYYSFARKTYKWWKKVALHLLHLSRVQAYILYKKTVVSPVSQEQFTRQIAQQLLAFNPRPAQQKRPGRPSVAVDAHRLSGRDVGHFLDAIPPTEKRMNPTRLCVVCTFPAGKRKKYLRKAESRYQCVKCGNMALCITPCFQLYHTVQDYKSAAKEYYGLRECDL